MTDKNSDLTKPEVYTYTIVSPASLFEQVDEAYLIEEHTKQALTMYERTFRKSGEHMSTHLYYPMEDNDTVHTIINIKL